MFFYRKHSGLKFTDGITLTTFGIPKTVRIMPTRRPRPYVKEARTLKFYSDVARYDRTELLIFCNGNIGQAKIVLENHLRAQAKKFFHHRTRELAALMQTSYGRITIRAQKSRWGSCSRANNLNFNWRLIFFPSAIAEYVIIHELAHTVHHNHSKKFYAFVEKFCPDYKTLRKKLRHHEPLPPI